MDDIRKHLKRDYITNPLQHREPPLYEDFYYLYITCNLTTIEMEEYFNKSHQALYYYAKKFKLKKTKEAKMECVKRTNLRKFGVEFCARSKECQEKAKRTSLEKYGVEFPAQSQEVREKIEKTNLQRYGTKRPAQNEEIKERVKNDWLKKYGCFYTQTEEFKDKAKKTCVERYGVENAMHCPELVEKFKQQNIEKYGTPWVMQNSDVKEKAKQTCLEKYGASNRSNSHLSPETYEIISNKENLQKFLEANPHQSVYELAEKLKISESGLGKRLVQFDLGDLVVRKITKAELELQKLFPTFKKTKRVIPPYEIDLYNEEHKIGIEYNGDYWHSIKFKDKYYHQAKSLMAKDKGVFLYHIFEHEWNDLQKRELMLKQIRRMIEPTCISEIKEVENGLVMGEDLLFFKDNVITQFTWNFKPLFEYYVKKYNPKKVKVTIDIAKENDKIFLDCGFRCKRYLQPKLHGEVYDCGREVLEWQL